VRAVATQTRAQGGLRCAAAAGGTPGPLGAAGSRCSPHQSWLRLHGTIPQPSRCRLRLRWPWPRSCLSALLLLLAAMEKNRLHGGRGGGVKLALARSLTMLVGIPATGNMVLITQPNIHSPSNPRARTLINAYSREKPHDRNNCSKSMNPNDSRSSATRATSLNRQARLPVGRT
jgi:hypothetical protein